MIEIDDSGQITLQAGKSTVGAKIILKPNGNIEIIPGPDGLVHLGGPEDAPNAFAVCGVPASPDGGEANPEANGITTTLGSKAFTTGDPAQLLAVATEATLTVIASAQGAPSPGLFENAGPVTVDDGATSTKVVFKA